MSRSSRLRPHRRSDFGALASACTAVFFEKYQRRKFFLIALTTKFFILGQPTALLNQREGTTAGGLISPQQVGMHRLGPSTAALNLGRQFPQQMRPAQTVTAFASQKIRYHRADASAVMDDPVVAVLKYALLGTKCFFAPLRMYEQVGVLSVAGHRVGGPM